MAVARREYLNRHKRFRIDRKKLVIIFPVIAIIVAIGVFWWLKLVGITITGEAFCGAEEHTHGEDCYVSMPVCGVASHDHGNECYKSIFVCDREEHIHTSDCFSDLNADLECEDDWIATFEEVDFTVDAPHNILEIAKTQVGYTESEKNFKYNENGETDRYTRYGEWYGNPYGDWNAMFVSFCLEYSGAENIDDLLAASAETMRLAWEREGYYATETDTDHLGGYIVFLDGDSDSVADRVGIVSHLSDEVLVTVEGDSDGTVAVVTYEDPSSVMGYGLTDSLSVDPEAISGITGSTDIPLAQASGIINKPTYFLAGNTGSNITYTSHLEGELINISIADIHGVPVENGGTVYIGESYMVSLEFSEINTGNQWIQFRHDEDGYLTYNIPPNLECDPFTEWKPISAVTESGTMVDVGEFFVTGDERLLVRFNDGTAGVNFLDKFSNVDFTVNFKATIAATQSGSSTEIKFNDEIKVNLNVDGGAAYTVEKTHGEFNKDDHTLEYTVKVEATHGVVHDLVIHDQIWDTHHALTDTVVVTDLDGNILDPQPVLSAEPNTSIVGAGGFTITGFPDFAAGDGFLITYKSEVNHDQLGNESVGLWNSISGSGSDTNGNPVNVYTEDWVTVELKKLAKEGKQAIIVDDNGNTVSLIEWEVIIHKNAEDLEGTVIIDTLGDGLSYYTDKKIHIVRYDEWGYKLPDVELSWDDITVDGNRLTFELPAGHAFHITYYSLHTDVTEGGEAQFNNRVEATINGKLEQTNGWADVVGFVPRISKSASGDDGEYAYFTIEADVPAVIKDRGNFFLTDLAAFWGYNNDMGYLYVENKPVDMVITAVTQSGQTITFTHYTEGGPTENTYILVSPATGDLEHSFNIYFNTAEPNKADSKWILDEASVLTVTYKIPFDARTGTEWSGELTGDLTLKDVLLQDYALANEAYLDYTDIISDTATTQYTYSPMIMKDSVIEDNGEIDYTVTFRNTVPGSNGNQGYLGESTDMVYFTDTFDQKLEYVEGTFTVTCYDPWRPWLWLCKYTYNGSIDSNTISIKATDLILSECNPEAEENGWSIQWWLSTLTDYQKYYQNSAGGNHVFTYTLKVKDEYLYSTDDVRYTFDNTAELTWDQNGSSGPVSEKTEFETGLLDKQAVRKDSKLEFDIHINRYALDMLEGTDTITIEDTMTENLSVYWDTIKVFYEDPQGNWIDFDSAESAYSYSVTYDHIHNRLTFTLPDSLHMRIDYTTLITENGFVSLSNNVRVDGKANVTDIFDAIFRVDDHSGDASGSIHKITLLKQDGLSLVPLPDATFLLYGPMGDPDAVLPDGAAGGILAKDGSWLGYIGSYTTGADGIVEIETQYLTLGGPYALVETVAPNGYECMDEPTYFYFYDKGHDDSIQTVTTLIVVENFNEVILFPGTGGLGTQHLTIIGTALMSTPILYSILRRKRERRLKISVDRLTTADNARKEN